MFTKIIRWTMHDSAALQQLGLAVIRIGVGVIFIIFGYNKLISGTANLTQIGSAMSLFGITRGYIFWGYLAALTELCAGLTYVIGFCTRIASLPLICLLVVALRYHITKGDPFTTWGFACSLLCVAVGFFIAGSGTFSIDHVLHSDEQTPH
jgi:putative oxidoreductase